MITPPAMPSTNAVAYRRSAMYAQGQDAFQKAMELGGGSADTLNELAICLMELGKLDESGKRLSEALRLDPENPKIISNLAILSLRRGRDAEARGFFRSVLEIAPGDPIAIKYLQDTGDAADDEVE